MQPTKPPAKTFGLQRVIASDGLVVNREKRREILGVELLVQKNRIIIDPETDEAVSCKIVDMSNTGFRVGALPGRELPPGIAAGAEFVLEVNRQGRFLVQVRWVNKTQCGVTKLRRLDGAQA